MLHPRLCTYAHGWIFLALLLLFAGMRPADAALAAPVLTAPQQNATEVATSVLCTWQAPGAGSYSYWLQVATDEGFTALTKDIDTLTTNSATVAGLAPGTTYYWRVKAFGGGSESPWSTSGIFTTTMNAPQVPAVPVLIAPADAEVLAGVTVTLSWEAAARAAVYSVQVAQNDGFTTGLLTRSGITDTTASFAGLANATRYYWRVRAQNGSGGSDWSAIRSFATAGSVVNPPDAPRLVAPADSATDQATTLRLTWQAAERATSYSVQLATDQAFTAGVIARNQLTTTGVEISGLATGTKYYWRVRAANGAGSGAWSSTWVFTTVAGATQPPAAPILSSPVLGATNVATAARLTWQAVATATGYRVQVAWNDTFTQGVIQRDNLTTTSVDFPALAGSTQYFWRVQAVNAIGTGNWSVVWRFTTAAGTTRPPSVPVMTAPADGATDVAFPITLSWEATNGAAYYVVQMAKDEAFTDTLVTTDQITANTLSISGLQGHAPYYWRVKAVNSGGESAWAEAWSFTTGTSDIQPPAVPTLATPANNATNVPMTVTLCWNAAARAETYTLQIAKNAVFTDGVVTKTSIVATEAEVSGLLSKTCYYWRVKADNGGGSSAWTLARSFTTVSATGTLPGVPQLADPASNAIGVSRTAQLSWQPVTAAATYYAQIATNSTFTEGLRGRNYITGTTTEFTGLLAQTRYYWRVKANNSAGQSAWSTVWSFTTADEVVPVPAAPILGTPAHGATGIASTVCFTWNPAARATRYVLQWAKDATFPGASTSTRQISTGLSCEVTGLTNSTRYYWRVRGVNSSGEGKWSATRYFTTAVNADALAAAPVLLAPANGATNIVLDPQLSWNPALRAETYVLQLARNATFTEGVVTRALLTTPASKFTGLVDNTRYYWRVKGVNAAGHGPWSPVWSFMTVAFATNPPMAPVLLTPDDGAANQPTTMRLTWQASAAATSYTAEIARDDLFTEGVQSQNALAGTVAEFVNLPVGVTWYWRVNARNDGGISAWSEVRSFTTTTSSTMVPAAPVLATPSNNASDLSTTVRLSWNAAARAATYTVQLCEDASFIQSDLISVQTRNGITVTSAEFAGLRSGTKYYWRVKALNATGDSPWSLVWNFTTISKINNTAPALISPANAAQKVTVTPRLTWSAVLTATSYTLEYAKDAAFTSSKVSKDKQTATSLTLPELDTATTYYWRVKAVNATEESLWSQIWSFTTDATTGLPPAKPVLTAPANGAADCSTTSKLTWNAVPTTATYVVQLARNSAFTTGLIERTGLTKPTVEITNLLTSTLYFWRVRAVNVNGDGEWSDVRSFTTSAGTGSDLLAPNLLLPADGALNIMTNPRVSWEALKDATSYTVQLARNIGFTEGVQTQDGLTGLTADFSNLLLNTTYYWRVCGADTAGNGDWSTVRRFTTLSDSSLVPAVPALVSPSHNTIEMPLTARVSWSAAVRAATYTVQLATNAAFTAGVQEKTALTTTSTSFSGLLPGTCYYWRVRGVNDKGQSNWSLVRAFTTVPPSALPPAPIGVSPANNAQGVSATPRLSWTEVNGATKYIVQVATDAEFLSLAYSNELAATVDEQASLQPGTQYYWRVRAVNANGPGDWSTVKTFTTAAASGGAGSK